MYFIFFILYKSIIMNSFDNNFGEAGRRAVEGDLGEASTFGSDLVEATAVDVLDGCENVIMKDLENWFIINSKKVSKVSIPIKFDIAKEAGIAKTKEGPVAYEKGHYLVNNYLSPVYPVSPHAFNCLYEVTAFSGGCEAVTAKSGGLSEGCAIPKVIEKTAKLATDDGIITTSWGILSYKKDLDYIVRHSSGDYGVVDVEIFKTTYRVIN